MNDLQDRGIEGIQEPLTDLLCEECRENLEQASKDVKLRVQRCLYIVQNIDRKAVRERGDEHIRHVVVCEEVLKHIGIGTMQPEKLTPSMHAHLEELFVVTQPNYEWTAEQEEQIRAMCAKSGVVIDD